VKFLGVDLGWQSQPSGLCCLAWQATPRPSLELLDLTCRATHPEVLAWIDNCAPHRSAAAEPALVAVDAPTLISNASGMRTADRLTHRQFGKYHAGCYPANLARPFALQTVAFGQSLSQRGFSHAPTIQPQQPGRCQIEVFPHPATVNLFGLMQILKYKRGRLAERRVELARYRNLIMTVLPQLEPSLTIAANATATATPLMTDLPSSGTALKALEDQLDSLICAYVAAHWWYWGLAHNLVIGPDDPQRCAIEGYIIVPQRYQIVSN
jgi:predicted RNase H-like nuclease